MLRATVTPMALATLLRTQIFLAPTSKANCTPKLCTKNLASKSPPQNTLKTVQAANPESRLHTKALSKDKAQKKTRSKMLNPRTPKTTCLKKERILRQPAAM